MMDQKITPIKRKRVSEEVFRQLFDMINDHIYSPGDQLPSERELAERFKVSRASVREAVKTLETMGLIESSVGVGGGNFVKEVSLETMISPFASFLDHKKNLLVEMMEYRLVLETEIARLAAERRNDEDLKKIEASVEAMRKEVADGGLGLSGDNMFHEYVASATHNQVFVHMQELAKTLLEKTRESSLSVKGIPQRGIEQHRRIFEAIRAGSPKAAAEAMHEHITEAMINVQKHEGINQGSDQSSGI